MAIVRGSTNRNILIGTSEADRIFVLNADYILSGLERDDLLKGGEGDDTLDGDANRDLIAVSGAPGGVSFTLVQSASDTGLNLSALGFGIHTYRNVEGVIAASFGDQLSGSRLDDTLRGEDGDDILIGGAGQDALQGGQSADRFIWEPGGGA